MISDYFEHGRHGGGTETTEIIVLPIYQQFNVVKSLADLSYRRNDRKVKGGQVLALAHLCVFSS